MASGNRRQFFATAGSALLLAGRPARAADPHAGFAAAAQRMKQQAIDAGDQPYGAVVVRDGAIIGHGPSRVLAERDPDAHAERVALRDARQRFGDQAVAGAVLYSTSRPCPVCQLAAAAAGIARMRVGPDAVDGGKP